MKFFLLDKDITCEIMLEKTMIIVIHFAAAFKIIAPFNEKTVQKMLTWKMKETHTPKILQRNQNMESLYFIEPEFSTTAKGARQNILDIYIRGLKAWYIFMSKYAYNISSLIQRRKYLNIPI
jgi:hypothetical protein